MIQTNCHTCKKIIQKSERDFKKSKSGFHFCSKSCSAIYSNTLRIKLPQEVCKCCNKNLTKRYRKELFCSYVCKIEFNMKNSTIITRYKHNTRTTAYSNIRASARAYSSYFYPANCMLCGYDKHFEVCHINPITLLKDDEPIYNINKLSNLVHLCPNCHWEFDRQGANADKIKTIVSNFLRENNLTDK